MKISEIGENIMLAMDSMRSNKVRSILASLGVLIGISTVILMGWVLSGLQSAMDDTFKIIGVDMIYIDKWDWAGGKNWKEIRNRKNISLEQIEDFQNLIQSAEIVFPSARDWGGSIKYGSNNYNGISILGTTFHHGLTPAGETSIGRHFTKFEEDTKANVVVIGSKVAETIFPNGDAIGKTIKIQGHHFTIIGVIKKQGTSFLDFIDNQAFMPIGSFIKVFGKINRSISIGVKAGSEERLDEVRAESRGIMRTIRNLQPYEEDDFSINETKAFEEQTAIIKLYVWGVGIGMTVLSFLVGIIGIMNIMFVSVAERTKEIGIRKAIGAKKRSILFQVISEASSLCLMGAFISLIFCSIIAFAVATILPKFVPQAEFLTPYLPLELLLIASIVSLIVGILAGLIPAIRAANLDPVEALRSE
ncbi:MAG: ABC transporter permease [Candidatus Kapaibacterium sp.]|jgi:putative ABC transport system permease protein|nr:ABC transporter permease [Candidatus Kapabacteria bacterium]